LAINASVRRFSHRLVQIQKFPSYAFNFASATEICVELDSHSYDYPILPYSLPSKPMISLKKLSFAFSQSPSILSDGKRLARIFPNLTDLSIKSGRFDTTLLALEALPSTLRRLDLDGLFSRSPMSPVKLINLTLLAKISQNLEVLRLSSFRIILGPKESSDQFQFSDSLLDFSLDDLQVPQLLSKLPKYLEHLKVSVMGKRSPDIPVSTLPATLRTCQVFGTVFVLDGPFPPQLETWSAKATWKSVPSNFSFPSSLKDINCPWYSFDPDLELIPKSLTALNASDINLVSRHIQNLPPFLSELYLRGANPEIYPLLPTTLKRLHIVSHHSGILTREVCDRLESLEKLVCYLHHFESASCLSAFKCLKILEWSITEEELTFEEQLFSNFQKSCLQSVESVLLGLMGRAPFWPIWLTQFKECQHLKTLKCSFFDIARAAGNDSMPLYLKCLPPSLTVLDVPPIAVHPLSIYQTQQIEASNSSPDFIECFHHLPTTLQSLSFGSAIWDPVSQQYMPVVLSDDCFTHLPTSLTHLNLINVCGLTERLWEIIPRMIGELDFSPKTLEEAPSFRKLSKEYLAKLEEVR
jgi:hypothetical protein